ncbi:hypothetical protein [Paenibacillus sedimenti]|uniref:Essential protein Yae1 N-terminal domain-containing protein n=1 Tax=Paenibacillus sedimenti TaxID=2770274 RepID=A0A926KQI7_9BACL|nr:hypothetical protein [Paenibacillus sedimenti]MBD0381622.1 hypothetical protein [Paenibacillus sedimenti]
MRVRQTVRKKRKNMTRYKKKLTSTTLRKTKKIKTVKVVKKRYRYSLSAIQRGGYDLGFNRGYDSGYEDGFSKGFEDGYEFTYSAS